MGEFCQFLTELPADHTIVIVSRFYFQRQIVCSGDVLPYCLENKNISLSSA